MKYVNVNKYLKAFTVLMMVGLVFQRPVNAAQDDKPLVVAAVHGGAWKCAASDPSVRTSVKPGDSLGPGDRLETFQGNEVQVALDPRGQNLVAIRGSFQVRRNEKGTDIRLDRGQALAILDELNGEDFKVTTPTGTAAVRGTRFAVHAPFESMFVKTFQGRVLVQAISPRTGQGVGSSVLVDRGHKTHVEAGSRQGLSTAALSARDMQEYKKNYERIRATRASLRANGGRWFAESREAPRSVNVPASKDDNSNKDQAGQTIVF